MRDLERLWPGTAQLPRAPLATLPTRVSRLEGLPVAAPLYAKHDEETSARYGGNKVRKLEYILGDALAKGADTIVTMGALGSHHVLATSIFGRDHGLEVHAVLVPQPWTTHVEENVRADVAAGARIHRVGSYAGAISTMYALASREKLRGRQAYVVPPGGSSPVGAVGYVAAGVELAAQIDRGELPEPAAVYVALGSGGTVVGIALGLAAAGIHARVVGVRTTERWMANRATLGVLMRRTLAHVRTADIRFPDVAAIAANMLDIDAEEAGRGYGYPTATSARASTLAEKVGLFLDPTYTSKAFASVLRDATRTQKPIVYWNTLSSAPLDDLLAQAPRAPRWVRSFAERAK